MVVHENPLNCGHAILQNYLSNICNLCLESIKRFETSTLIEKTSNSGPITWSNRRVNSPMFTFTIRWKQPEIITKIFQISRFFFINVLVYVKLFRNIFHISFSYCFPSRIAWPRNFCLQISYFELFDFEIN